MAADEIAGIVDIAAEGLAEFIHPHMTFRPVGANQRMHGKHIHLVVMRFGTLGQHTVPQGGVINDMVAAHQPRQVEGLAGGIQRHRALPGVLADRLGGGMLVAVEQDIGPDLVRDDHAVIGAVHFHSLLNLAAFPYTAAGVVG